MEKYKQNKPVHKIQYVWGLISQSSAIDRDRSNVSAFNIIDQIHISAEAFEEEGGQKVKIGHEILITWRRVVRAELADKALSCDSRIKLIDPNGSVLQENANEFRLQQHSRRTRQRIRVDGLIVTQPGDYVYRVDVKEAGVDDFRIVNEIPFELRIRE